MIEKILFQEICASWKQMLGIEEKTIFSIKRYLQTLNTSGRVILTLSFSDNVIFTEELLF